MQADHFTPQSSNNFFKTDLHVPDEDIESFLGLGLAYSEWPAEIEKRNHPWYPGLEKIIIEKEWQFFKEEIQRLRSEPKIAQSSRSKSNSLASILKRLKGETWMKGYPDEREERLRTHRLLGKDAKIRCLQKYVSAWDQDLAISASPLPVQNITAKPTAVDIPHYPITQNNSSVEIGSHCDPSETWHPSQYPVGISNSDLLSTVQTPILPPNINISNRHHGSKLSEAFPNSPLNLISNRATSSINYSPISEDEVPNSASHSQSVSNQEPELNVLEWLATNQVSEAEVPYPFPGIIVSPDSNIEIDENLFIGNCGTQERSTGEIIAKNSAGEHNQYLESPEVPSHNILSPPSISHGHKRRRQNTSDAFWDMPNYGDLVNPTTSYITSDGDTLMSSCESGSQYENQPPSQGSWKQSAPPSRPLPTPPYPRNTSKPTYKHIRKHIRKHIELEQELQRTKLELDSERRRNKKEVDSLIQKWQIAEGENSELHGQVRELQASIEYYEQLAREAISQKIILQEANERERIVSSRPSTSNKEREHNTKHIQSFPPSKYPRPLSLTIRPATTSKASSQPHRKLSASTLQHGFTSQLPNSTNPSSRPGSSESIQSPPVQFVSEFSPPKPTSRHHWSESADSIPSSNFSNSNRRDPLQQFMHKVSHPFLRKQYREDSSRIVRPAPTLPPLEASVPLDRQMARILVDGNKRLTDDSGYQSLLFENSPRTSMANTDYEDKHD